MSGSRTASVGWLGAPPAAALLVGAAAWRGVPLVALVGGAALFAFVAVLTYSSTARLARRLALATFGLAWFCAPFSGVEVAAQITLPELALLAAAACALIPPCRRMEVDRAASCPAIGYLALIIVGAFLGAAVATDTEGNALYAARLAISGIVPLLVLRRFDPTARELAWLTGAWVGGVLVSSVVGLVGPPAPSGRAIGLAGHSNQLAMMAAMALPLTIVLASRHGSALLRRPLVVAMVGLLLVTVVMSGARSGLLAMAVVVALICYRYIGVLATVVVAALVTTAVVMSGIPQAMADDATSAFGRFASDEATAGSDSGREELLTEHWNELRGVTAILGSGFDPSSTRPHNVVLHVWGSAGILGLLGLAGLTIPVVADAVRRRPGTHPLTVAAAIGFLGYLVALSFNNAFELVYVWTFYALWERWRSIPCTTQRPDPSPSSPSSERLGAAPRSSPPIWPSTRASTPPG